MKRIHAETNMMTNSMMDKELGIGMKLRRHTVDQTQAESMSLKLDEIDSIEDPLEINAREYVFGKG